MNIFDKKRKTWEKFLTRFSTRIGVRSHPYRYVIRMHKEDGEEFSLFQIQSEIVAAVQKKSCLELTIVTGDNAEHPLIPQLIRFAIRLGIRTTVCVDGELQSLACLSLWTQAGLDCLELSMGRKHGDVLIDTVPKIATCLETLREEFDVDWGISIYFDDWLLEEIVPIWDVAREQNAPYFALRLFDEEGGRELKREIVEYFTAMQAIDDTLPPLLQRFIPNVLAHADVLHVRIEQTLYAKPQIVSYRQRVGRRRLWRYIVNGENGNHLSVLTLNQR